MERLRLKKRQLDSGGSPSRNRPSRDAEQRAATKIQQVWRMWRQYIELNRDYLEMLRVWATAIQARWRSYHVMRARLDIAASVIQRHFRGILVRRVLRRNNAAVRIQRRMIGLLCRQRLALLNVSALKIQCLIRGGIARHFYNRKLGFMTDVALVIQRQLRAYWNRIDALQKMGDARRVKLMTQCALQCQRFFRGTQGRRDAERMRRRFLVDLKKYKAAERIQTLVRRDLAIRRVQEIRLAKRSHMNYAATYIRKYWLCYMCRRKFIELKLEFLDHVDPVVIVQRYARGFLTRYHMYQAAVRAETELWASSEISRIWRGYVGRVRWEAIYEETWSRHIGARRIQTLVRGWLARLRTGRKRRAEAERKFKTLHKRYVAAQRIQAVTRGVQVRAHVRIRLAEVHSAARCIQRNWRGHSLRIQLWKQVLHDRATKIQSWMRGFLLRFRLQCLYQNVRLIQARFRYHLSRTTPAQRTQLHKLSKSRVAKVRLIQQHYRGHLKTVALRGNGVYKMDLSDEGIRNAYGADMDPQTIYRIRHEHLLARSMAESVLSGVYNRLEGKWQRNASKIQRNFRVNKKGFTPTSARALPRAQAPLRGNLAEGSAVGAVYRQL